MPTAVVFDLDDTLAVTDGDRAALLAAAADRAGVSLSFDREAYLDAHREHSGAESRRPVFDALVDSDAPALTRAYRETIGEALTPIEGAASVLETLRGRYRLGLLTDGPGRTQRDKLRRLDWADAFDAVVVTGPIGAPKPDRRAGDTSRRRRDDPAFGVRHATCRPRGPLRRRRERRVEPPSRRPRARRTPASAAVRRPSAGF